MLLLVMKKETDCTKHPYITGEETMKIFEKITGHTRDEMAYTDIPELDQRKFPIDNTFKLDGYPTEEFLKL